MRITSLGTLKEPRDDTVHASLVSLEGVGVHAVLVFEDLLLHNIVVVLVSIDLGSVVDEIV